MDIIEAIESSKSQFIAKTGNEPVICFIHPDHAEVVKDFKEIVGIKIYVPTWRDLDMIAMMCGVSAKDECFWDKNNAFLMDQDAYDRLIKPSFVLAPSE